MCGASHPNKPQDFDGLEEKFDLEEVFGVDAAHAQYHINLRMNLARRLLRETKSSDVDVAIDVGYANPSHFAKLFPQKPACLRATTVGSVDPGFQKNPFFQ